MNLLLSTCLFAVAISAEPTDIYSHWEPAGPNDFRGPCPAMNTLANHGFLPRDGRYLTEEVITKALFDALNFDPALSKIMFEQALPANPDPNATFFTLDQLNRHNVLEHDASLSRQDAYFGNNHIFDAKIFDQTTRYWTGDILDRAMMANSKLARQIQSKATNPAYRFTETAEHFSIGEILGPFMIFGDREAVTVRKDRMVYFFENERFPTHLGFTRPENVTLAVITRLQGIFTEANSLITKDEAIDAKKMKRGDSHVGVLV